MTQETGTTTSEQPLRGGPDGGPAAPEGAAGARPGGVADQAAEDVVVDGAAPVPEPVAGEPYESPEEMALRVKELTGDLQRLQAEYVNYKRRVDRDRDLVLQNAKFSILSALLPVLDDVDRAREHEELTGGFKAVAESLERVVLGEGLVKFGATGDAFDPRLHEAIGTRPSAEVAITSLDRVVQAGYRVGERLVRPALVTVVEPDPTVPRPDGAPLPEARPDDVD